LWLSSNDTEIKPVLLRPQEIPLFVADGRLDCGLAGFDWITENGCNDSVRILADLCYSKRSFRPVRWVLAVKDDAPYQTVDDLKKSRSSPLRVSTELRATTENWLAERGISAEVDFSWGATEAKVPVFADAIVEATETGSSLRANGLRILETIIASTTQFFANKDVYKKDEWKRTKLDGIALLLKSCLAAETKVNVNVRMPSQIEVDVVKGLIPSDASFSVWQGQTGGMLIDIIIEKEKSRDLIPTLVRNGATKVSVTSLGMLYDANGRS
jgi:ATP phosphoribosyltransferase